MCSCSKSTRGGGAAPGPTPGPHPAAPRRAPVVTIGGRRIPRRKDSRGLNVREVRKEITRLSHNFAKFSGGRLASHPTPIIPYSVYSEKKIPYSEKIYQILGFWGSKKNQQTSAVRWGYYFLPLSLKNHERKYTQYTQYITIYC